MNAVALLVATAVLGVDYGWHRLPNGEWEYIIQVEPALVETLVQGQALVSQMPPELQGVRRFRVQVGDGEVPREQLPTTPIGGAVGGIPVPGALGTNTSTGIGGLATPGGAGASGGNTFRSGTGFGGSRAATPPGSWPIGVDPRVIGQLRSYEWVSVEPIELLPLENDFLRQLGGPQPMSQDDQPWEQFTPRTSPPASRWPGSNPRGTSPYTTQPLDDRTTLDRSPLGGMVRDWNKNGGSSPWKLDQFGNRVAADPRDAGLLPRPMGDEPGADRDIERFDLNDEQPGGSGFGGSRTASAWPPANGKAGRTPASGQFASGGTERGVIEDREAGRQSPSGSQASTGRGTASNGSPFTTTRHTRGALTAEVVGAQVWWPLTMTVVLLFASLGGNLYLGWLALDFYRRYREAAWELRTSDGPAG